MILERAAHALYRRAPLPLALKARIRDGLYSRLPRADAHVPYARWIARNDTLTDDDRSRIEAHIASFDTRPTVSVLMPVFNTPAAFLRQAIESVLNQLYPNWELCVVDDASTETHVRQILDEWAGRDERMRVAFRDSNGGISACTNTALEMSSGDWIVLLDHDDVLAEHALYLVAETINRHPDAAIIYSDEDHIDGNGRRSNPYFKPDWDYDLFLGQNLINHLGAYRTDVVKQVGGFRAGLEGSQDWDLALRVVEAAPDASVQHVPFVLYHWRQTAQAFSRTSIVRAARAAERSVTEHLARTSQRADVVVHGESTYLQTRRQLPASRLLVSIVIPTRDRPDLLRTCLTGLLERTAYDPIEIVIVDNGSTDTDAISLLDDVQRRPRVKIIQDPAEFNFSRLVNAGVAASSGDVCVLLNNDIDVIREDWLAEMVSHAMRPDVGAVGAKLYYDNDTIQHAGVILGLGGVAGHAYRGRPRDSSGYFGQLQLTHNVSCVTAACLAVRREVYDTVGGFNEKDLSVAFNDVDFCVRVRQAGLKILWTPHAELYHYESLSRGYETTPAKARRFRAEAEYMRAQWADVLDSDPFYNRNLSLASDYRLSEVTRVSKPWRAIASGAPADADVDRPAVPPDTARPTQSAPATSAPVDTTYKVRNLRPETAISRFRSVVLVGHSAAGKSRLARLMGLDRHTTDFDAYAVGRHDDRLAIFDRFLKSGARLLIAPNDLRLLSHLAERKASDYQDVAVVYLCRPRDVIRSNLAIANEDQRRHPAMSSSQFDGHYELYDSASMSAADYVLDYRGADIDEIAFAFDALVDSLTGVDPSPMAVEDRLNLFHEYYRTRAARRAAPPTLLTEDRMKQLTAGGYQVFDARVFPPVPAPGSIAARKLDDLRWTADEFAGMTVAEIGSQLGFFGFVAASLGAELVTGTDINPEFVAEANKMAVHYAGELGWQDDRVMFRTHALAVGDVIPGSPDVIVANSIVHWFIIQSPELSIEDVLSWLRDNANVGVYFEGCVSASEQIMRDHGVSLDRYSEERFLHAASSVFRRHRVVGRCSYNPQRLVARLYR